LKFSPLSYVSASLLAALGACSPAAPSSPGGDAATDTASNDVPATPDVETDTPATPDGGADVPVTPDAGMMGGSTAVLAYQGDPGRTGANRTETRLTPDTVRAGFGRDTTFAPTIAGDIYGQPLYVPGVSVGGAARDLLFVATEQNNAYALDAATGAEVWRTNLGPTVSRSQQSCGNINTLGVTSTGVIDPATRTLYLVSFVNQGGIGFKLNALDLATGMQRSGYPVAIAPPMNNGSSFDTRVTGQRGALAFRNGVVYVPFGGLFGDCGIYHGWVVSIPAATPAQQTAFATPGRGSGIWAPGGFSMDAMGRIFAATGNSTPLGGHTPGSLGEFVLRLATGPTGASFEMSDRAAQFSPNDARNLDLQDLDIGSVAPVLLPGTPSRLVQGGKAGSLYLLDADNLGGNTPLQSLRVCSGGIFGALGAWSNGTDTYVFTPARGTRSGCSGSNGVMALRVENGATMSTAWCTASVANANPPVVSSNGNNNAILWVTGSNTQGGSPVLRAYEVSTGMEIYANTEPPPSVRHWVPPVVADGKVYVTGATTVSLYRAR
jgi:outer membrane protein assembly factor BamB